MREEEIWKDIEGYEGLYQVSNMGRVKSLSRMKWSGRGYFKTPEKILKARPFKNGYLYVNLWKDGKMKHYTIHRLVSQAFIPNPNNLPQVNHIDENKENNCVDNLEWVTCKENLNHGTHNKRMAEKKKGRKQSEESIKKRVEKNTNHPKLSKPIIGIDIVTGLIVEFPSAHEASRVLGIFQANITSCLKGRYKTAGGFVWHYVDTEE